MELKDLTFEFIGHLADTATNIRHGKNGTKITLQVPNTELPKVINLPFLDVGDTLLKITIRPATEDEINGVELRQEEDDDPDIGYGTA